MNEDRNLELDIQDFARRLGWAEDKLEAERKRTISPQVLLRRMDHEWKRLCARAEKEGAKTWAEEESERRRLEHEQDSAVFMAEILRERERESVGKRIGSVLSEMEVLQENTSGSDFQPPITGTKERPELRLASKPLIDEWEPRFRQLVRLAERDLDVALGRVDRKQDSGTERDERIIRDYEGEPSELAALIEGCSQRHIEKIRRDYNRSAKNGRERKAA